MLLKKQNTSKYKSKKQSLLHSDGHYLAVEKAVQKEAIIGTCLHNMF